MKINLRDCTTIEQVLERVADLIDVGQADTARCSMTRLLLEQQDPDFIDAYVEAETAWHAETRAQALAEVRAWCEEFEAAR